MKTFPLLPRPMGGWLPILGLIVISGLLIALNLGALLRLLFPAGAVMVAVLLYQRYPILYLGFTWWIWFLSPWVRRMADFSGGWQEPNPVMLTPFMVTFVCGLTLVQKLPFISVVGGVPFLLTTAGVFYGLLVGLINGATPTALVTSFLYWITPVLFGFHLFSHWREYPAYRSNIYRCFLWGVLVMGSYGILQYLVAPQWDRLWMVQSEMPVIGTPEPLQIRVFSTLNSPGPFAQVLSAGLLLLLSNNKLLQGPAALVGYLAFLLSLARSAWICWLIGILTLLQTSRVRLQMRLSMTIVIMALLVVPLTMVEPFASVISTRVQSLTTPEEDVSYNERMDTYRRSVDLIFSQGMGSGLGVVARDSNLVLDSGLLEMLFGMGWFGSIPYLLGLGLLFGQVMRRMSNDAFINTSRSICLGTGITIVLGNVLIGMPGVVLWGFLSMALAGMRYEMRHELEEEFLSNAPSPRLGEEGGG
jgi:hypothetical protein